MGDLLSDLEEFVLSLAQTTYLSLQQQNEAEVLCVRIEERRVKQEEMRRNVEELHRIGGRIISSGTKQQQAEGEHFD